MNIEIFNCFPIKGVYCELTINNKHAFEMNMQV